MLWSNWLAREVFIVKIELSPLKKYIYDNDNNVLDGYRVIFFFRESLDGICMLMRLVAWHDEENLNLNLDSIKL